MPRDLPTAQAELAEAKAALEALQERVRDGDQDVTPEQLATQRELISFAELRVEAAQRTETRFREEEWAALGAATKKAAGQLIAGAGMDEVADAARAAADAIAHLAALAQARNGQIEEIGTTLARLDNDLAAATDAEQNSGPWASRRYGVWGDRSRVVVDGLGNASALDIGRLTMLAIVAGLGSTDEGLRAQTQHGNSFHGLRNMTIRELLKQYPQLTDAFAVTPEQFAAASTRGRYELSEQGRHPTPQGVPA
jgi:hypothetical protein